VLVVRVDNAPPHPRRRLGRAKPRNSDPADAGPAVPRTTLTVVRPEALGEQEAAAAWLAGLRDDPDAVAAELAAGVEFLNRAVHAHRAATLDTAIADVTAGAALAVRVGFGTGEDLAEGAYAEAIEVPLGERRRRAELLRPQERVAEVLGGRGTVPACELLLIRARADLDAGRTREAALQLRVGLEALLAEREALAAPDQDKDFAALDERRQVTGEAANEALAGDLSEARAAEVTETLRISERVLRRKRALG
jgi:hypothetical protein